MDRNTKHTTLDCGDMYEYYLTTIRVRMDTGSHILYSSRVNSPFVPSWYLARSCVWRRRKVCIEKCG